MKVMTDAIMTTERGVDAFPQSLFLLFCMYGCFACICMSHIHALPEDARRGCLIPGPGIAYGCELICG